MAEDLRPEQLEPALRAWACWCGCAEQSKTRWAEGLQWLTILWDEGLERLPLGLVFDLGNLLRSGRDFDFASARWLSEWPEHERAARLRYEDEVLGRWALDPSVLDAHVAVAGLPPAAREGAIAHAIGLALGGYVRGLEHELLGNPAAVRTRLDALAEGLSQRPPWRPEEGSERWREWARAQLEELTAKLPTGRLFGPEALWELAHLDRLPNASSRLALRTLHALCARVGPVDPSVALSVRRRAREVPVDAEESDHYPAGGFDAVSTRGTFENLVRSEVAYVGAGREGPEGVDLFDVRFAESELLYYTRDESPLLDARREFTLVVDAPSQLRVKHPDAPAQTLSLLLALALTLQADLLRLFGPAGARFTLLFRAHDGPDEAIATEELSLLSLALASELAHRRAWLGVERPSKQRAQGGYRLLCSGAERPEDEDAAGALHARGALWTFDGVAFDLAAGTVALRALADAILVALARGAPRSTT